MPSALQAHLTALLKPLLLEQEAPSNGGSPQELSILPSKLGGDGLFTVLPHSNSKPLITIPTSSVLTIPLSLLSPVGNAVRETFENCRGVEPPSRLFTFLLDMAVGLKDPEHR